MRKLNMKLVSFMKKQEIIIYFIEINIYDQIIILIIVFIEKNI